MKRLFKKRGALLLSAAAALIPLGLTAAPAAAHAAPAAVASAPTGTGGLSVTGVNIYNLFHPGGGIHPATGCTTTCGYDLTVATNQNNLAGVTSASVQVTTTQQGVQGSVGHTWEPNHSLGEMWVEGQCAAGNTSCTAAPLVEIAMTTGQEYCHGAMHPCFSAASWKNGQETFTGGYTQVTEPDDGSYHPGFTAGHVTLGYQLDDVDQKLFITVNGTNMGYFPYSYWGQSTFGPLIDEAVQSEILNSDGNFGTAPEPSMDYTFSNFTDTNGNGLSAVSVGPVSTYTASGVVGAAGSVTGWTTSGGRAPSNTTTSWPIEMSADAGAIFQGGECMADQSGTKSNGNGIVLEDCLSYTSDQAWRYDPTSQEMQYQAGGTGGWCLDDPGNSTSNGVQLVLEACSGLTGEKMTQVSVGNAYTEWKFANGVVCIQNPSNSTTAGDPVETQACSGSQAQQTDSYNY